MRVLAYLRNCRSSGRMTGKPSCHSEQDAWYEDEALSTFSTEYVKKDFVDRRGIS